MRILVVDNHVHAGKHVDPIGNLVAKTGGASRGCVERISYQDFGPTFIENQLAEFDAVILSGSEALYSRIEDRAKFAETIRGIRLLRRPVLGICAGHQLIGMAYGEEVVCMEGYQTGYREVEVLLDDPLFEGLGSNIVVAESHREMLEHVPGEFLILARSPITPVEAMRSETRDVYGVQFHPELYDSTDPDGELILANFLNLAKE
jgi:GMP synthase (glutamine-hydrolysing)